MFGIMTQDRARVLCNRTGSNVYILKAWIRASMPAIRKSEADIDQLFQTLPKELTRLGLQVFQFTEEQLEKIVIKKLQGY